MRAWLFVAFCSIGCATTGTRTAQRFTGDPYDVKSEGDRVTGLVCGVAIDYTVDQGGNRTVLGSFGRAARLEITNTGGAKHIVGTLGTRVGADEVDLTLTGNRLTGRAGLRDFDLTADGDRLHGVMGTLHLQGYVEATIEGREALMALPDAAVAAVLPTLLNCDRSFGRHGMQPSLLVRAGGPPGYEPRENNSER